MPAVGQVGRTTMRRVRSAVVEELIDDALLDLELRPILRTRRTRRLRRPGSRRRRLSLSIDSSASSSEADSSGAHHPASTKRASMILTWLVS